MSEKLTNLPVGNEANEGDKLYIVQDGISKQIDIADILKGITLQLVSDNGEVSTTPIELTNGIILGTANGDYLVDSKNTETSTSGQENYGARFVTNAQPSGNSSAFVIALAGRVNYNSANTNSNGVAGVLGNADVTNEKPLVVMGVDAHAIYSGSNTTIQAGSLYGVRSDVKINGGGYYNHIMAYKANPPILENGSTADKIWGVYIADVNVAGGNDYSALKIEGSNVENRIEFGLLSALYEIGSLKLKTNSDLVFNNAKYLRFEDSDGNEKGQIGVISGNSIQIINDRGIVINNTNASDAYNFDIKGNGTNYLRVKMGTGNVAIGRNSANEKLHVEGNIKAEGVVNTKGYTVATLPTGSIGDTAYVTDALAPTYLGVLIGGGSVTTPAFFDGSNWVAH